jgi:hypothetical protein
MTVSTVRGMHLGHVLKKSTDETGNRVFFDGRDAWVFFPSDFRIYEISATTTADNGTLTPADENAAITELEVYDTIENGNFFAKGGDFLYVTTYEGGSSIAFFDTIYQVHIPSRQIFGKFSFPKNSKGVTTKMNSNIVFAEDKLFMVENYEESIGANQKVWVFDIKQKKFSTIQLTVKPQKTKAYLAECSTGFVYISNYNNLSLTKIDANALTITNVIRGNAFPGVLIGTPEKKIATASFGGLLSFLDSTDTFTHSLNTEKEVQAIAYQDVNTYWALDVTGRLIRATSDNALIGNAADWTGDYVIVTSAPKNTMDDDLGEYQGGVIDNSGNFLNDYSIPETYHDFTIAPEFKYQRWDGTSLVDMDLKPRVIVIADNTLFVINTDEIKFCYPTPEVKRSSITISGKAMVSFGPSNYLGEKG